ncbi:MAG: sigma 54-interacting transcriptional regulator [Smithellaceae bacterium]|nr:sigma 54-interacting transcriptional regulator [Smithellaceae bacterium]
MINRIPKHLKKYFTGRSSPVRVSLFVLIPFIFTGFAVLAFIIAYYAGRASTFQLFLLGGVVIAFTALSAVVVTYAVLSPVQKFIDQVESSPSFPKPPSQPEAESKPYARDELRYYDHVFTEVANLISKVDARDRFPGIIGQSRAIRGCLSQVIKVAPTDNTVLLLGESGVGKELFAEAIYRESNRLGKPFIKLNCVAIVAGLLESELFGHEKGSFTGATAKKTGKFELANEGTLFLDEIGDIQLETQAKLLRVLQEREFQRVGGNETIKINVRFIAASNKNLHQMVKEGTFREDLFYRLNVFPIYIPPLKDRVEDIPLIARHILENMPEKRELSPEAMRELMTWSWPGNVRELRNVLERASVMADQGRITSVGLTRRTNMPEHHHETVADNITTGKEAEDTVVLKEDPKISEGFSLDEHLAKSEKEIILSVLKKAGGVQARAAKLLGINQRSLWHRIKKYEIDVSAIKNNDSLSP